MKNNEVFQLFDEYVPILLIFMDFRREYHHLKGRVVDPILIESVYETTETHIATFILAILHQGLFSVTSLIVGIIYLSRFKEVTRVSLHSYTWRLLFLTALLIADKANEDRPIKNGSLARLFPVVTSEELNVLEVTMLMKVRFAIFIKSELFHSFVEKLLKESISTEINSIVSNSDFATQQLLPSMRTVPCTPEPFLVATPSATTKSARRQYIFPSASTRSRSKQPQMFIQNLMDSSGLLHTPASGAACSPVLHVSMSAKESSFSGRGRSASVSRKHATSPSLHEENSLEYSRTSSRRLSTGRPAHVPPPPIFEPFKFQGHPRRFSLGPSPRVRSSELPSPMQHIKPNSPRSRTFLSVPNNHRLGNTVHRWNNMF